MSKFIDKITCEVLGGRKLMDKPYKPKDNEWAKPGVNVESTYDEYTQLFNYRIGVEFMNYFYAADDSEVFRMKEQFIAEVKEVIYGDLRSSLRDLEHHMFNQDREKMKSTLMEIFREVD